MVLDKLGESLKGTLNKITSALFVDDKLINELVKDIQRALLQSDVNVKLVLELSNHIKSRIKNEKTPPGLSKKEHLIKIVYDELVNFLGGEAEKINLDKKPTKIMLVGLFGSGKTTTAGKLGKYFRTRGKKVALISTDTWRPAAFNQLKQLGKQIEVAVFGKPEEKDPVKIYKEFEAELNEYDVVIIDTAGRDALSEDLIEELDKMHKVVQADEKLLVISGDIGQTAERQATAFHDTVGVTGVIVTKLEGTAKGGGVLAACSVTGAKVKFIGVGEKVDDLEPFNPKGFVGRILGMGDIESLLDKAQVAISEEDAKDLGKKFLSGEYNLIDLYEQMEAMKKMGSMRKLIEMIPGMGQLKLPKEALDVQEEKLKKWKFIMNSCTKHELEDPESIDSSRAERIAKGSGTKVQEVRELVKQYRTSKKMMKMFKGQDLENADMNKMMRKFGGKKMPGMMKGFKGF
ncbi:MAG: signal recognition particle protein Srp54 [Candidatus Woesearchaeota archaeon]